MVIPLAFFYYCYLAFVVFFLVVSFFCLYHLLRFGFLNIGIAAVIAVYILIAVGFLSISWFYIGQIDWHQNIEIQTQLPSSSI